MSNGLEHKVINVYRSHGHAWAALRGDRPAEGSWIDRFCSVLPVGSEVLDIGCGSGVPIARALVQRGFRVTGLDGAPEMVALFQRNIPDQTAVIADMRALSLGRRFAGLLAWDSFFHLCPADQRGMFTRLRTHAAADAVLMFTSGVSEGSAVGDLEGEALYHGSLGPDEYRSLLDDNGFDVMQHVVKDASCDRTVWLARVREAVLF